MLRPLFLCVPGLALSAVTGTVLAAVVAVKGDGPPTLPSHSATERETMTKSDIAILGIDLGKKSCSLAGLDASGAVVLRRRMTRNGVLRFVATLSRWRLAAALTFLVGLKRIWT